jgi:phosphoribosylformylglycinamidine synthase I
MKFGVVTFPGSNCDYDAFAAVKFIIKKDVDFLWHKSESLEGSDVIILPGGFSYGDYLRPGAIARFSPIMKSVIKFARSGGIVVGICNGFQVLLESGLLPGALMRNSHLRFAHRHIYLKVENSLTPFSNACPPGKTLKIPIAHGDGNYYSFRADLEKLRDHGQIVFTYATADGQVTPEANPNGSLMNIAGICNQEGNILGMMPHPERAVEKILGSDDGIYVFNSLVAHFEKQRAATG